MFYLSTMGKDRGYSANGALNLGDTNTIVVTTVNIIRAATGARMDLSQSVGIRRSRLPMRTTPSRSRLIIPKPSSPNLKPCQRYGASLATAPLGFVHWQINGVKMTRRRVT